MKQKILVTGSSGYVCSFLIPLLASKFDVLAVDVKPGKHTNVIMDIVDLNSQDHLSSADKYVVIHCASARFDYGIKADVYFKENVSKTKVFLKNLTAVNITQFIHVSSVAAIDGESIEYNDGLNCDNAYRATKYLQQRAVIAWCRQNNVPWDVVLPSAIYDDTPRSDTNIGMLQTITRFFPVLPKIEVQKSLTFLPKFCAFIEERVGAPSETCFLTIEEPVRSVTQIMHDQARGKIWTIHVPGLKYYLLSLSWILLGIAKMMRREPTLIPSRVKKLFSNTSYATDDRRINRKAYKASKL